MKKLEEIIHYTFKDKKLLKQALKHSSLSSKVGENYERLEFLGDRVLSLAVADLLYANFPKEPEGSLSQRHVALVCKETVAKVALKIGLEKFMEVESDAIRTNDNVLCDVCEAVIGAVFLDGGFLAVYDLVKSYWGKLLKMNIEPPKDAKTRLQEVAHVLGIGAPEYAVVSRSGTEHEPVFYVSVKVGKEKLQFGEGRNKKLAEQTAAGNMLEALHGCK